jgi:hypothetical protein
MPIITPQVIVNIIKREELVCDKAHILNLVVSGVGRDKLPPTAVLIVLPYVVADDGSLVFAADDQQISMSTNDLYKAAVAIPKISVAMQAVFAAASDWISYRNERLKEADLVKNEYDIAQENTKESQQRLITKEDDFQIANVELNELVIQGVEEIQIEAKRQEIQDILEQLRTLQEDLQSLQDMSNNLYQKFIKAQAAVQDPASPKL